MIVANIDDSKEPTFQNKYKKSIVIDRYGRKVGVIGVIIHNTDVSKIEIKLFFLSIVEVS